MRSAEREALSFKPVTPTEWEDLRGLFSEHGVQNGCWCMYWRVRRADFHRNYGDKNRQTMQHIIDSGRVPGILAYTGGVPVGWCSVAPREDFPVLQRSRTLKPLDDQPVWSIVCFFVSHPHRHTGVSTALLKAAVAYAREQGARIVEAYPLISADRQSPGSELYMGILSAFLQAGFREVMRRSERRAILRLHLDA